MKAHFLPSALKNFTIFKSLSSLTQKQKKSSFWSISFISKVHRLLKVIFNYRIVLRKQFEPVFIIIKHFEVDFSKENSIIL